MKKIIGVMPLYDEEKDSYWMLPGYMKMLEAERAVPMMLPLTDDAEELDFFLELCGGFLLTGGQDVDPSVYGEAPKSWCGESCRLRDRMDGYILKRAIELDKSVLGICRGIQFMNAYLGGSLYQDLGQEYGSSVEHHMTPPYDRAVHQVQIRKDTMLYEILGVEQLGVNSYHHQAVKELAPSLAALAVSEDGLTEAVCVPDRTFVVGVQWHPECSYQSDACSRKLVKAFVDSIRG